MVTISEKINSANQVIGEKLVTAKTILIDARPAIEVIPGMTKNTILHAGPPIVWEKMCGPMQGGIIAALIYEKMASSPTDARYMAASGEIKFSPCHHYHAVGSMAGIISASVPVFVVRNETEGNEAYSPVNEGVGSSFRYGNYSNESLNKLCWTANVLTPVLHNVLRKSNGISIRNITAQALQMGDEGHNRNDAGTLIFLKEIMPLLLKTSYSKNTISEIFQYISSVSTFFLNITMASNKAIMDAVHGIEDGTIVTAMARNGVEIGIKVSGLGDRWFTAPATRIKGLYFPGYSENDATPDLGDSAISETAGMGAFAMAAAPAFMQFIGGTYIDAINNTKRMMEITVAKNNNYAIPALNFEGTPTGIDIRKVVETGIEPLINTAIPHKNPEVGQMIGAGSAYAPIELFQQALRAFGEKLGL